MVSYHPCRDYDTCAQRGQDNADKLGLRDAALPPVLLLVRINEVELIACTSTYGRDCHVCYSVIAYRTCGKL
jgi:hypothetical protein